MRIALRLAVLAATAFVVVLLMAASAGASVTLGVEPAGPIRAVSEGRLTFEGGGLVVQCNVTFNGEIALGVSKGGARTLPEGLTGDLEEARFAECRESFGFATEVRSLLEPSRRAELVYNSFLGTLPSITGVLLTALGMTMQIRGLATCLYRGEVGFLVTFPAEGGGNRGRMLGETRLALVSGGETCPREGAVRGNLRITPSQTALLRTERMESAAISETESAERGVQTVLITITFGAPTIIRAFIDVPREGSARIDAEARCRERLWWGERCAVRITGVTRPASGELIIEYQRLLSVRELRSRYIRL